MSQLLDFYRGDGADCDGRRLAQIWRWDDDVLETVHDFIQWLFPLPEPSPFNRRAPLLTGDDIAAFHAEPVLQANLQRSFERILTFLGLALAEDGRVVEGPDFAHRRRDVWDEPNHNWLRITRIIRSTLLLGLEQQARAIYDRLRVMYDSRKYPISAETFDYWTAAIDGKVPGS
jgi:hypothetical protein